MGKHQHSRLFSRRFDPDVLNSIVADATFLWEPTADPGPLLGTVNGDDENDVPALLDQWCRTAADGNWDQLHRRVLWDGLDWESLRLRFRKVQLASAMRSPPWALEECSPHQPIVDLIGGEPLLYPLLCDVVKLASRRKVLAVVTTNGLKLAQNAEALVRSELPLLQTAVSKPYCSLLQTASDDC